MFENLKCKVRNHFLLNSDRKLNVNGLKQAYMQGADDCLQYLMHKAWNVITEDLDSYPKPSATPVLVKEDNGRINVAYLDADNRWFVSNGKETLALSGRVEKWMELD